MTNAQMMDAKPARTDTRFDEQVCRCQQPDPGQINAVRKISEVAKRRCRVVHDSKAKSGADGGAEKRRQNQSTRD